MDNRHRTFLDHPTTFRKGTSLSHHQHPQFSQRTGASQEVLQDECACATSVCEHKSKETSSLSGSVPVPVPTTTPNAKSPIPQRKNVKELISVWDSQAKENMPIVNFNGSSQKMRSRRPHVPRRHIVTSKNLTYIKNGIPADATFETEKSIWTSSAKPPVVVHQPRSESIPLLPTEHTVIEPKPKDQGGGGDRDRCDGTISTDADVDHCDTKIFKTKKPEVSRSPPVEKTVNYNRHSECCLCACLSCWAECCIDIMQCI